MNERQGEVRGRAGGWIVLACLLVVLSPLLQMFTTTGSMPLEAISAALVIGAITVALYLRTLRHAQRDHPDPP